MASWIKIYLAVASVLALALSGLAYVNPGLQFGSWEALGAAGATSLGGPLGVYIARNIATGLLGLLALARGSASLVFAALFIRLVQDGIDTAHNYLAGNMPIAVFAGVMAVIDLLALLAVVRSSR